MKLQGIRLGGTGGGRYITLYLIGRSEKRRYSSKPVPTGLARVVDGILEMMFTGLMLWPVDVTSIINTDHTSLVPKAPAGGLKVASRALPL